MGRQSSNTGRQNNRANYGNFKNNQEDEQHRKNNQQPYDAGGPVQQPPAYVVNTFQQPKANTFQQPKAYSPQPRQAFGKQQSNLAESVGITQKSYAQTRGPNKPSVAVNAQKSNPRAQLPNLDDINQEFQGNTRRRQVDYNQHYATTEAISNPIKDKLKRSKLRNKKASGLLGSVNNTSGNSVLDSYRNLGRKLIR